MRNAFKRALGDQTAPPPARHPAESAVPSAYAAAAAPVRSSIDRFEWVGNQRLYVQGWAIGSHALAGVQVLLDGQPLAQLNAGLHRADVEAAFVGTPHAECAGFEGEVEVGHLSEAVHTIELLALMPPAAPVSLGRRIVLPHGYQHAWSALLDERGTSEDDVFYLPIATSHVGQTGAVDIKDTFAAYESRTVKVGMRVQILYLRTTHGAQADYTFDPDFVADKYVGERLVAEDSLNEVIRVAIAQDLPVLFTLNGGIWADSACESVEWDANDALEQDESLCQWNEKNQVMPDSALSDLPGSVASPELGRCLSLSVFLPKVRHYKKRNLQQAAALIARFATEYPALFIGVNLDPDVYINPFFEGAQWYDYNPATLRQFRHWLRGDGPYAGQCEPGVPDLSRYRRAKPLTLAEVDALTGQQHRNWDEVDAPRQFPTKLQKFWKDPWVGVWEHFRRHLVQQHYDELSQWVAEAGVSRERVYTSQGFMPPADLIDPLPVRLDSPAKNYDTGGMSIEGSAPTHGHLGAIIYGKSAVNDIKMEGPASLFDEFRRYSPGWAVVEFNTADLTAPDRLAPYSDAYRALRDIANYGGRFISPMAWNGSPGDTVGTPGFRSYTALRRSPLEEAMQHFMLARADLPRSARLWTFGCATHADDDGWRIDGVPAKSKHAGQLPLPLGRQGRATLTSPAELAAAGMVLVVRLDNPDANISLEVQGHICDGTHDGIWHTALPATAWSTLKSSAAGAWVPLNTASRMPPFQQLRLIWRGQPGTALMLKSIALYPG
ncbi:hypothetical protein [Ottowia sp.]|uniref:hypothetical protein n=1 Tax=Ottowia sp. TaxID=1898956 RepID=UPI003A83AE58